MRLPLSGFVFLLGYVTLIGVASFLEKFSVKQLNPYQVNFLMAVGTGLPLYLRFWIKEGSLAVPAKALPLGCAYRPVNGDRFDLFCPGSSEAACGNGDSDLNQLRGAGCIVFASLFNESIGLMKARVSP